MRTVILVVAAIAFVAPIAKAQNQPAISVRSLMPEQEFERAGLGKLTATELARLDAWLSVFAASIIQLSTANLGSFSTPTRGPEYVVDAAVNDETFVINGEVFKAQTYCFGINPGDRVIFVSGSAFGACVSAEFVVVSTGRTCRCWCE